MAKADHMFCKIGFARNPAAALCGFEWLESLTHETGDNLGSWDIGIAQGARFVGSRGESGWCKVAECIQSERGLLAESYSGINCRADRKIVCESVHSESPDSRN